MPADAIYRAGQNGVLRFGPETGMRAPNANTLEAVPALQIVGYGNVPQLSKPEGTQVVNAVGSYTGVRTVPGARSPSGRCSVKLGNVDFLRYGLRSSAIGANYNGLPVLALQGGAAAAAGSAGFGWLLRYGMINSISISYQEGQAVTAEIEFVGLCLDTNGAVPDAMDFTTLDSLAASVLTWYHADFLIGGATYRDYIRSAQVTIQNNVQRIGGRLDSGFDVALSRVPLSLLPGLEVTQVSYQLYSQFAAELIDAATDAGNWGTVQFNTTDSAVNDVDPKAMSVTVDNTMLAGVDLQAVEAGQPFGFTAQGVGRGVSIAVS